MADASTPAAGASAPVYEARYGWDRKTTAVLVGCVLFTVALLALDVSTLLRVAGLVLFGGGALVMAYGAFSRKVAFRVDGTGVLLGGTPLRYKATTAHVPWADITGLVLWRQDAGGTTLPWIGVARRPGAPALPGDSPTGRAVVAPLVPVPPDVVLSSRAVNGWRLDRHRLAAALAHFAPGLPVHGDH